MTNKEKAELLRGAASALEHGRQATANKKLTAVFNELYGELFDLLHQDVFTDAVEYRERVNRIEELLDVNNPNHPAIDKPCDCDADRSGNTERQHAAWCQSSSR